MSLLNMQSDGLFLRIRDERALKICQYFEANQLMGADYADRMLMVCFHTPDGCQHHLIIKRADLIGSSDKVPRQLAASGFDLNMDPKALRQLKKYLFNCQPNTRCDLVSYAGLHDGFFVQPGLVIGCPNEQLHYAGPVNEHAHMSRSGSLTTWKFTVCSLCIGNPLLMLMLCLAFTAPLLRVLGMQSFGFHIWGDSSTGKTFLGKLANSIWGYYERMRSWNMSQAGLEFLTRSFRDSFLPLDEIGEVPKKRLTPLIYQLSNGRTRSLAGSGGHALQLIYYSSGEKSVQEMLKDENSEVMNGLLIRMLNLPVTVGGKYGVLDELHGRANPGVLIEELEGLCSQHFGTPIVIFLEYFLQQNPADLKAQFEQLVTNFLVDHEISDHSGFVRRVARQFCLCAFAGELAGRWGITGWEKGSAIKAAGQMFAAWKEHQQGYTDAVAEQVIDQIRDFLQRYAAYIVPLQPNSNIPLERVSSRTIGFSRKSEDIEHTYILASLFTHTALRGLNPERSCRILIDRGMLIPALDSGKSYKTVRLPACSGGTKAQRIYQLSI